MLHNKNLKIFYSLHLTISMADFLSFQVVVDLRFFLYKIFFLCMCSWKTVKVSFICIGNCYISYFQSSRLVLRMGEGWRIYPL